MPRPTPDKVQQEARRELETPPRFTRPDGTPVTSGDVPEDARRRLEGARRAVLNGLANNRGIARRMSEALDSEDREAIGRVMNEIPGIPRDVTFDEVELVPDNMTARFRFCLAIMGVANLCVDVVLQF